MATMVTSGLGQIDPLGVTASSVVTPQGSYTTDSVREWYGSPVSQSNLRIISPQPRQQAVPMPNPLSALMVNEYEKKEGVPSSPKKNRYYENLLKKTTNKKARMAIVIAYDAYKKQEELKREAKELLDRQEEDLKTIERSRKRWKINSRKVISQQQYIKELSKKKKEELVTFFAEMIEKVKQLPQVEEVGTDGAEIFITTKPIFVKKESWKQEKEAGRYQIKIDFSQKTINQGVRMLNITRRFDYYDHPCISDTKVCWGNIHDDIEEDFKRHDLPELTNDLIGFLSSPDDKNGYIGMRDAPGEGKDGWETFFKKAKDWDMSWAKYNKLVPRDYPNIEHAEVSGQIRQAIPPAGANFTALATQALTMENTTIERTIGLPISCIRNRELDYGVLLDMLGLNAELQMPIRNLILNSIGHPEWNTTQIITRLEVHNISDPMNNRLQFEMRGNHAGESFSYSYLSGFNPFARVAFDNVIVDFPHETIVTLRNGEEIRNQFNMRHLHQGVYNEVPTPEGTSLTETSFQSAVSQLQENTRQRVMMNEIRREMVRTDEEVERPDPAVQERRPESPQTSWYPTPIQISDFDRVVGELSVPG